VYGWRRHDAEFGERFKTAQQLCAEVHADAALTLHADIPDPKVAKVASDNLWRWLAARSPETFGQRPAPPSDQPQLIAILQAAVNRLIEAVPPAAPQALPAVDAQAQMIESTRQEPPSINSSARRADVIEARRFSAGPQEDHRP
jgi:hypothetical protein